MSTNKDDNQINGNSTSEIQQTSQLSCVLDNPNSHVDSDENDQVDNLNFDLETQNGLNDDPSEHTGRDDAARVIDRPPEIPEGKKKTRRFVVAMYIISLTLLYSDYNLLAPNLSAVGKEFGMTDEERDVKLGGQVALAFFLVGAPASFLIGWLADAFPRPQLFACTILIGELACFSTYFVTTFGGLFATRTLTGISVGGSLPIVYSVLGDLYQAEGRNAISGVVATATGIGLGVGQALAGFLGPTYGWRLPFLIVSAPALLFGFCQFFVPEPKRGHEEKAVIELERKARMHNHEHVAPPALVYEANLQSATTLLAQSSTPALVYEANLQSATTLLAQSSTPALVYEANSQSATTLLAQSSTHALVYEANSQPATTLLAQSSTTALSNDARNAKASTEIEYSSEVPTFKSTLAMLKAPSVALILAQGAPSVIPFGITSTFLNDYLAQDKGMTVEEATGVLLTFGAGNAVGVVLGGTLGHFLYKYDVRFPSIVMGISIILSCFPMWYIISSVDSESNLGIASVAMFSAGILTIIPIPIERAILSNVTLPETRGRAMAFLNIIDDLGKGFGPYLLSLLIAQLGRETAFKISLTGWLLGGSISLGLFSTIRNDEMSLQETIFRRLESHNQEFLNNDNVHR